MQGVVEYDISSLKGALANAFLILINALFFNVQLIGLRDVYPRDYNERLLNEDDSTFDFIIVGAGAAGCAVANRITEQEMWSVLLIEAGDYPTTSSDVPGLYETLRGSKEDWNFLLEKDRRACQGMIGNRCRLTKGKVLGGTSTINNMRYVRGTQEDYDKNEMTYWTSNVTYSIFQQIESYVGDENMQHQYGTSGEIYLNLINITTDLQNVIRNAYRGTGYPSMPKRSFVGHTEHLVFVKNGERYNMAKAFLTPIKERPNLFFTKNTEVEGVVVTEPIDKRASGVNVSIDGARFFIRARKEVILTAGAINNAKLLMVSGMGPRKYLSEKNIPIVADLPAVGKNLQLHLSVPIFIAIDPCAGCPKDYYREIDLINDVFDYVMHRTGNLSQINEFVNYIVKDKSGTSMPDMSVHHSYFRINDRVLPPFLEGLNYIPKIINSILTYNDERAIICFFVTMLSPLSRGDLYLNDTHFLGNPKIYPNFMTDDEDVDFNNMLSGFNYVTNMTEGESLKERNAEFLKLDIPNCRNFKFCSVHYVRCYIHNMAFPQWDVSGTVKMGAGCEPISVVKQDLETKTVRCLRVGDSSVLASIPAGNTVTTDAMIGYNLGEILKEKWIKDYRSPYLPQSDSVS